MAKETKERRLFKYFVEALSGREFDEEEARTTLEDLTEYEEDLSESYGSDRLYSLFGAVRDLLQEEIEAKTGERPSLMVIDRLWDAKDGQGLIYDPDKKAVIVDDWIKYPTSPWSLGELAATLTNIYNEALPRVKELYGVELEPLNGEEVYDGIDEYVEEMKEKLNSPEQGEEVEDDYSPEL